MADNRICRLFDVFRVQEVDILKHVQSLSNPNILEYVATHLDYNATMGLPRLTIVTELCSGGEVS